MGLRKDIYSFTMPVVGASLIGSFSLFSKPSYVIPSRPDLKVYEVANVPRIDGIRLHSIYTIEGRFERAFRFHEITRAVEERWGVPKDYLLALGIQESMGNPVIPNLGNKKTSFGDWPLPKESLFKLKYECNPHLRPGDGGAGFIHMQPLLSTEFGLNLITPSKKLIDRKQAEVISQTLAKTNFDLAKMAVYDDRFNVVLNTNAAGQMLRYYYDKTKSWDTALVRFSGRKTYPSIIKGYAKMAADDTFLEKLNQKFNKINADATIEDYYTKKEKPLTFDKYLDFNHKYYASQFDLDTFLDGQAIHEGAYKGMKTDERPMAFADAAKTVVDNNKNADVLVQKNAGVESKISTDAEVTQVSDISYSPKLAQSIKRARKPKAPKQLKDMTIDELLEKAAGKHPATASAVTMTNVVLEPVKTISYKVPNHDFVEEKLSSKYDAGMMVSKMKRIDWTKVADPNIQDYTLQDPKEIAEYAGNIVARKLSVAAALQDVSQKQSQDYHNQKTSKYKSPKAVLPQIGLPDLSYSTRTTQELSAIADLRPEVDLSNIKPLLTTSKASYDDEIADRTVVKKQKPRLPRMPKSQELLAKQDTPAVRKLQPIEAPKIAKLEIMPAEKKAKPAKTRRQQVPKPLQISVDVPVIANVVPFNRYEGSSRQLNAEDVAAGDLDNGLDIEEVIANVSAPRITREYSGSKIPTKMFYSDNIPSLQSFTNRSAVPIHSARFAPHEDKVDEEFERLRWSA